MFETPYFDYGNTIGQLEIPISTADFLVGPQHGGGEDIGTWDSTICRC